MDDGGALTMDGVSLRRDETGTPAVAEIEVNRRTGEIAISRGRGET